MKPINQEKSMTANAFYTIPFSKVDLERFQRIFISKVRVRKIEGRRNVYEVTILKEVADLLGLEYGDYAEFGIRKLGK